MITNVSLVSVWVKDIDESLAFYTDVLGFEPGDDIRMGEDFRWTTVFHPKQPELHLHLTTPSKPLSDDLIAAMRRAQDEGGLPGVGLHVDDCRATYEDLRAKGVEFLQEPEKFLEMKHGAADAHLQMISLMPHELVCVDWKKGQV